MSVLDYLYGKETAERMVTSDWRRFTLVNLRPRDEYRTVRKVKDATDEYLRKMDTPFVIGISPDDHELANYEPVAISIKIAKIVNYLHTELRVKAVICGEYSPCPSLRWHYHGYMAFKRMKDVLEAKRLFRRNIRCRVYIQKINNLEKVFSEYLFKTYMKTDIYNNKNYIGDALDSRNCIQTFDNNDYEDIDLS